MWVVSGFVFFVLVHVSVPYLNRAPPEKETKQKEKNKQHNKTKQVDSFGVHARKQTCSLKHVIDWFCSHGKVELEPQTTLRNELLQPKHMG